MIALSVGCSTPQPDDGPSESPSRSDDIAYVPESDDDAGLLSLFEGRVAREGGCTTLVDENGNLIVPMFPLGSASWEGEVLRVDVAGDEFDGAYSVGDLVEVPGGESTPDVAVYLPSGCDESATYWLVPG